MMPRSEDECKMAQSSFTSLQLRKFTVVQDVIKDFKASVSHNLFGFARVH